MMQQGMAPKVPMHEPRVLTIKVKESHVNIRRNESKNVDRVSCGILMLPYQPLRLASLPTTAA